MATRFYFDNVNLPTTTPLNNVNWEQLTGSNGQLVRKTAISSLVALSDSSPDTIPITTTQDIFCYNFISSPIPPQLITGTVSLVIRCSENATTNNATLAVIVTVFPGGKINSDPDRGTLFSVFGTDTEFPLTASSATRIITAQAITPLVTLPGDRISVQIGARATGPTAAGSFILRAGYSAASDFALTSALTTDLNPWVEFSQNIFAADFNNYQFVKVGNGMSVSEKIR